MRFRSIGLPSASKNKMSSGSGVLAIVNRALVSLPYTKIMPSYGASDRTSRNPCTRWCSVEATSTRMHRPPSATFVSPNSPNGVPAARDDSTCRRPGSWPPALPHATSSAAHATTHAITDLACDDTWALLLRELGFGGRSAVQAERVGHLVGHVIGLCARRVGAGAHVLAKACDRGGCLALQRRVLPYELRRASLALGEAQQVVPHEHLTVTVPTGADPDRRNADRLRDDARHTIRHAFEHQREHAG